MNLKSKIKQLLIDPLITPLLPGWAKFPQNRNDRIGALYKAWGHVINSNLGERITNLEYLKESAFVNHF